MMPTLSAASPTVISPWLNSSTTTADTVSAALKASPNSSKKTKTSASCLRSYQLSATSRKAPLAFALAAKRQGKYWEVHQALMKSKGLVNEALALKVAEELGLDMEKLKADANSDEVKAEIQSTKQLAQKMGINGTPHFLIGDKAVGGAPQNLYQLLKDHVDEFREAGCTYC